MARSLARSGTMMFTVHEQNFTTEQIKEYLKNTLISKMTVEYEEVSFGDWSHTIVTARS